MANLPPPPYISPIAEGRKEVMGSDWMRWFQQTVFTTLATTSTVFPQRIDLSAQSATIGTTNIPLPALVAGKYQLSYYARITTAAGVSSSVTVTTGWTESSVSLTHVGAAMTGNTTSTVQSDTFPIIIDGNTPITYSVAYASNPANAAQFRLSVWLAGPQ